MEEKTADVFKTLSNPTRIKMLKILSRKPLRVAELKEKLGEKQPMVSQHLRVFWYAGVVKRRRLGNEVYYELTGLGKKLLNFVKEVESEV